MDLAEWSGEWLEMKREFMKPTALATYKWRVRRLIVPEVGAVALEDVDSATFHTLGLALMRRGYSTRTIGGALTTTKGMMRSAAMNGLVEPRELVYEVPRAYDANESRRVQSLTREQAACAVAALTAECRDPATAPMAGFRRRASRESELENDRRHAACCLLAIGCGLRIGEASAVRAEDVDLAAGCVHVRRTSWEWCEGGHVEHAVGAPKTASSMRDVPLGRGVAGALRGCLGGGYVGTGTERPCDKRALRQWWYRLCDAIQVPRIRFHALRHTLATLLVDSGADPKTVSQIMGHSDVTTTLRIYTHPDMTAMADAVNGLELLG